MDTVAADYVRAELLKQLKAVEEALGNGRFQDLPSLLDQANDIAGGDAELAALVEEKRQTVAGFRQSQTAEWLAEAEALLGDEETFDEGRIGALLDNVEALAPQNPRAQQLREQLAEIAPQQRERRAYEAALRRCQVKWDQEQGMVEANVTSNEILEECYRSAVRIAEQSAADYPDSALMRGLMNKANIAYNLARDRYEMRSTAEKTGDYKSLIEGLSQERDRNKLIPWQDSKGQEQPPIKVADALLEAERLAANYAEQKAQEYMQKAQQHMAAHAPRAAKSALLKIRDLFMIDQETEASVNFYLRETVEPAVQQLGEAEKLLRRGETASDPQKGWELTEEAVETYEWTPGVADVRQALLPRLATQLERFIQDGRRHLENNRVSEALPLVEQAVDWSEIVVRYAAELAMTDLENRANQLRQEASALLGDCQAEDQLVRELAEATEKIEGLLKDQPGTAVQQWQELAAQHGEETIDRFPRLRQLRREVETHSDISLLLARLESAFASNKPHRIREAIADAEAALARPENADFRDDLAEAQERLELRLDYLTGLEVLVTSGDAETALQFFDPVAKQKKHPDAPAAQTEAEKIRSNKALEKKIGEAIKSAEAHLKAAKPRPRQAYEALLPFKNETSLRKREIDQLLYQARQGWEEQLISKVDEELAKSTPSPKQLRALAVELEKKLPEPRPIDVINQAKASAAAATARLHERAKEWPEAVNHWQEALSLDVLNPHYKAGWQSARKRAAEIELDQLDGDEAVRGLFEDLESDIPLDPEIRLWRAQYYDRQAQTKGINITDKRRYYGLAQEALTSARNALERMEGSDKVVGGKIKDLSQKVSEAEVLVRRQEAIERNLAVNRSLKEFSRARQEATELLTEYRQETAVTDWWQASRDHAIETLVNQDDALDAENTWERFDIRSKILTLNPDHTLAQQLLRELPVLAMEASQRVNRLIEDRDGLLVTAIDDLSVNEAQHREVSGAMDHGRAVYDMLQSFKEQIADPASTSLAGILRGDLERLQNFLTELDGLRQLKARAQSYLDQARVDGNWQNFQRVLRQMNEAGFNTHRMTEALGNEQERLQKRRRQLQQLQAEMMAAIEKEDFAAAQQIMLVMDNDEDLGDPRDKFGLRAHIQVNDPLGNGTITNWRVLRNWLGDQQAQLKQIGDWLVGAGLAAKLDEHNAVPPALTSEAPTGIVNWPEIESQVQNLVQYGRFNEADRVLEQTLIGNDGWFDNGERVLALETAVQRLRQAPVRMEQVTSHKARRLLEAGKVCHKELKPYIEATKGQQKTIQQKRQAWEDAFAELEQAFKELEVVNRNVIARWRNRERMDQVRENAHRALLNCRQIAAQHPSLAGLQDHPLLSG